MTTDKISRKTAEDEGWNLFADDANAGKFGILDSADWNVFNICVVAGFDPFKVGGLAAAVRIEMPGGDLHQAGMDGAILDLDEARAIVEAEGVRA